MCFKEYFLSGKTKTPKVSVEQVQSVVVELGFSLGRYLVGALMEHFLEGSSPLRLRKVSSETLKKQFVFVILLITNILICE